MAYQPDPITWDFHPDSKDVALGQQQALEWLLDTLASNHSGVVRRLRASLCERAQDGRDGSDDEVDVEGTDALINLLDAHR